MVRIGQSAPTSLDDEYTAYVGGRSPWLRQIAYLLCQDWHRADDLVQTAITGAGRAEPTTSTR